MHHYNQLRRHCEYELGEKAELLDPAMEIGVTVVMLKELIGLNCWIMTKMLSYNGHRGFPENAQVIYF